jgi:hypothetical protein
MRIAAAASNSMAKSRSETASSELVAISSKAQLPRDALAVDRKRRPGECRCAERQAVGALAAIGEALEVAREHRVIGQQVVAEGHRLRDLQVREARHDRVGMALGEVDEGVAHRDELVRERVDGAAQP